MCDGKDNDCNGKIDDNCIPPLITESKKPENTAKPLVKAEGPVLEVSLWPNPAREVLMVRLDAFEAGKKLELAIMQADGRVVASQSLIPAVIGQLVRFDVRGDDCGVLPGSGEAGWPHCDEAANNPALKLIFT